MNTYLARIVNGEDCYGFYDSERVFSEENIIFVPKEMITKDQLGKITMEEVKKLNEEWLKTYSSNSNPNFLTVNPEPVGSVRVHVDTVGKVILQSKIYQPEPSNDEINHPAHYTQGKIEVIDFLVDQKLGFREANIVKYICRYKMKGGLKDLKKAQFYLNHLINELENGQTE